MLVNLFWECLICTGLATSAHFLLVPQCLSHLSFIVCLSQNCLLMFYSFFSPQNCLVSVIHVLFMPKLLTHVLLILFAPELLSKCYSCFIHARIAYSCVTQVALLF